MLHVNFFQYTSEYKAIHGTSQSSVGGRRAECRTKKFVWQIIDVCVGFIEQVNIASFISELARFIHVVCIKESFQALDNV